MIVNVNYFYNPLFVETLSVCGAFAYFYYFHLSNESEFEFEQRATAWFLFFVYLLLPAHVRLHHPLGLNSVEFYKKQNDVLFPGDEPLRATWDEATKDCKKTNKKYLVVGAGFVGKRIIHALVNRKEERIFVLDRSLKALQEVKSLYGESVTTLCADVCNKLEVKAIFEKEKFEVVICNFAVIRFWEFLKRHLNRSKPNFLGVQNLLASAEENSCEKFLFVSSSAVLITLPCNNAGQVINESMPFCTAKNFFNDYGLSKAMGEKMVLESNGRAGMITGVIRPTTNIVGYRDVNCFDIIMQQGFIPSLCLNTRIDYVHVDDVVLSLLLLESKMTNVKSNVAGESFHITSCRIEDKITYGHFNLCVEKVSQAGLGKKLNFVHIPVRLMFLIGVVMDFLQFVYPFDLQETLGIEAMKLCGETYCSALQDFSLVSLKKANEVLGYHPRYLNPKQIATNIFREYKMGKIIQSENDVTKG